MATSMPKISWNGVWTTALGMALGSALTVFVVSPIIARVKQQQQGS